MRAQALIGGSLAAMALGGVVLAQSGERLARLNLEETQLSAEQAANMAQLARLLSVLEQIRRDPPPALLVSPQDAKDAVRAAILVKAMTPELQGRARTYASAANEMMRQRRLAAVQSEALFTTESLAAERTPEAEARGPAATPLPPMPADAIRPPDLLLTPVAGPVIRRYGAPLAGGGRANGVTIQTPRAARVTSPGAGAVQYVGPVKGWGVILILRLAGGYHLVLAGLERPSVSVGQSVAPGQPVGWMPDGRQSPSELYLEVREQGAPVDPGRWLNQSRG
ncbi:murein hydrolase activator EnvC family protein [Phenylobacterium sp.]|jgi:septal ring factor EnvC (AmiA/AmiB activator)|uniref:murein hydrolase activator EnvC family protein n=1 Tax=Phenylobacterium sp. TaxID=1871053 RepID=UPI002F9424A1